MESLLNPITLKKTDTKIKWGNLSGCSFALAIARLAQQQKAPYIIITQDIHTAEQLKLDIQFFSSTFLDIMIFPDWGDTSV